MNKEQYHALCETCDQLLLASDSSVERVAIPWLHVIRPHAIFLNKYLNIFTLRPLPIARARIRNFLSSLRHLTKAILGGGSFWTGVGEFPDRSDVLILSHLVSGSFRDAEDDFYYGKVACELTSQGLSTTIALINYTKSAPASLLRLWKESTINRVIFSPSLSFSEELALYRRAHKEARSLKCSQVLQPSTLGRRVLALAAEEASSGGAVSALRLGEQVKSLVTRLRPKAIIVTFEGHSWERVAFASARTVSPNILCIGYQHAALFNMQHAAQRKLANVYNPDVILTSGDVSRLRLQNNVQLRGTCIRTLGSNRSIRRQAVSFAQNREITRSSCLVLPEGIDSECILLFSFTLECAKRIPNIEFIWRLHPNMSFETLMQLNPKFRKLPSNVVLSKATLVEDIKRSRWAMYRGSTAIVQAVMSGVLPIYLHRSGEIPIDTLYEISHLRMRVKEVREFSSIATAIESPEAVANLELAQDYCAQLFTPMRSEVLAACIKESSDVTK